MKKLNQKRIMIIYLFYSLVLFSIILCIDMVPNHRVGWYTDYDLWLITSIFPLVFVLHGIVSKLITKKIKLYFPVIVTGVLGIIESFINVNELKHAIFGMLYYLVLTFVGVMVYYIVSWLVKCIKVIWKYRHGYSK